MARESEEDGEETSKMLKNRGEEIAGCAIPVFSEARFEAGDVEYGVKFVLLLM